MKTVTHKDKLLPTQEYFSHLYEAPDEYLRQIINLCSAYSKSFNGEDLTLRKPERVKIEEMSSPPTQLAFIEMLLSMNGASSALEIGTFVGRTTIQFAKIMGPKSKVTSVEIGQEFYEIACENVRNNGFSDQIELIKGDATDVIKSLNNRKFDFVYIDGAKEHYLDYALAAEKLLSERGVIVIDDVMFHGDALNIEPTTEKGIGCRKVLDHYLGRDDIKSHLLPIFNGILLVYGGN